MKQKIFLLLLMATTVRCVIAITTDLGNDEVYYTIYAQHLQWNYFDHPPMVALLIRLTTFNLFFKSNFFIRLGPMLLSAINTYLIYAICKKLKNENAGFIAALLYSASFYSGIIAGVFILPDAPQLFFWILSLSLLIKIVTDDKAGKKLNYNILYFGVITGLCIMSKVHGVFLWIGFGLYILCYKRSLLTNGYLYIAILITLLIISPIIIWNIDNHFITYTFHSKRVALTSSMHPDGFFREFFGGLFYNNPVNYFLIIITLVAIYKNKISLAIPISVKRLLLFLSLPLIILILLISLFRNTLPHWSGPGYTALLILTACYIDVKVTLKKIVSYSCALIVIVSVAGIVVINYYPGTLGEKKEKTLGKNDFTLDMYDWTFFKNEFQKMHQKDIRLKRTNTNFVINNKWFPSAHIDKYITQPLQMDFLAIGNLEDIHTYAWLNKCRKPLKAGDDAYFITFSNNFSSPDTCYKTMFDSIGSPIVIKQYRNNKPARNMLIYLLKGYKGDEMNSYFREIK